MFNKTLSIIEIFRKIGMRLTTSLLCACLFLFNASIINCWESYELDLFDLVEEVGQNFYDYFGLTQVIFQP